MKKLILLALLLSSTMLPNFIYAQCGPGEDQSAPVWITETNDPELGGTAPVIEVTCGDDHTFPIPQFTDSCPDVTLSYTETYHLTVCTAGGYAVRRRWVATDAAGNPSDVLVIVMWVIQDNNLNPRVVCPPDVTVNVACEDPNNLEITGEATIYTDDSCTPNDGFQAPTFVDEQNGNVITRTWSSPDACGFCTQRITLIDDPKACGIPTMSQWGLFILGLMLSAMALVAVVKRKAAKV